MSVLGRDVTSAKRLNQVEFEQKVTLAENLLNEIVRDIKTTKHNGSKTARKWPYKAPEGFLKRANLEPVLLSPLEEVKACVRCGKEELATGVQAALVHFVCTFCFKDKNDWAFKGKGDCIPNTIKEMHQMTLASKDSGEDD